MRRSESTFQHIRHDSDIDGGGSSVAATSPVAPAASRSKCPRIGSLMNSAASAATRMIGPKMMNGVRQEK